MMAKRIDSAKARALNQEYVTTRGKELDIIVDNQSGNKQRKDNLSTWFSVKELDTFISEVKTEASKNNINLTGFRFYVGAYPKNAAGKEALSTVFIVPTTDKKPTPGGTKTMESMDGPVKNYDIQTIDGLNEGQTGHPPGQEYPTDK